MVNLNIDIGQKVEVRTKKNYDRTDVAPSLLFKGQLVTVHKNFIEIVYYGSKAIQNEYGKVISWVPGVKVQRIYGSSIASVVKVGR